MIKRVEVFETMGLQFPTAKKAVEYRENLIEKFLRETPGFNELRGKDRIGFVQSIIDRRDELADLLDYSETETLEYSEGERDDE